MTRRYAYCATCGIKDYADQMLRDWKGRYQHRDCYDPKHPQEIQRRPQRKPYVAQWVQGKQEYFLPEQTSVHHHASIKFYARLGITHFVEGFEIETTVVDNFDVGTVYYVQFPLPAGLPCGTINSMPINYLAINDSCDVGSDLVTDTDVVLGSQQEVATFVDATATLATFGLSMDIALTEASKSLDVIILEDTIILASDSTTSATLQATQSTNFVELSSATDSLLASTVFGVSLTDISTTSDITSVAFTYKTEDFTSTVDLFDLALASSNSLDDVTSTAVNFSTSMTSNSVESSTSVATMTSAIYVALTANSTTVDNTSVAFTHRTEDSSTTSALLDLSSEGNNSLDDTVSTSVNFKTSITSNLDATTSTAVNLRTSATSSLVESSTSSAAIASTIYVPLLANSTTTAVFELSFGDNLAATAITLAALTTQQYTPQVINGGLINEIHI